MIVDAHGHIWNRVEGAIGGKTPVRPLRNGQIRIGERIVLGMPACMADCAARAEYFVAEMDAAGVDLAVVVQEYLDGQQNDYCLEAVRRYPERFCVHALPDFFQADRVADEAMALFARGFRGLKLSAMHLLDAIALDDPRLMPIFRHMEACDYVLAVDLAVSESQAGQMRNVLNFCPQLRVAIGHFGMINRGGWPAQLDLCRYPNVYMETGGIIWLFRNEGYPFPGAVQAIRQAADQVGIEKLMWGSDWPRTMVDFTYRQSLDFVRRSEAFQPDEKRKLLGENAARLYGIASPSQRREPLPLITEG
jgi:L-galactono-1,5-lactonase